MTLNNTGIPLPLDPDLLATFEAASNFAGRPAADMLRELIVEFVDRQYGAHRGGLSGDERTAIDAISPIAFVSHELRNPLNSMMGVLELLTETPMTSIQSQYVEVASETARTMRLLVDRFLDTEKHEAARVAVLNDPFDLGRLIDDVIRQHTYQAKSLSIELVSHVAPEVPAVVRGDFIRMQQVLANLLSNALKFTHHGEVSLHVSVQEQSDMGTALCFQVRDTGIGMDESQRQQAFVPYSQGCAPSAAKFGGTGLGLSICSQMVRLMGGMIMLESTPGLGTTVTFWLPMQPAPSAFRSSAIAKPLVAGMEQDRHPESIRTPVPARRSSLPKPPFRVLVVDDNRTNRMVAEGMLKMSGHDTCIAGDGDEAIAAVSNGKFDLILMDCAMPELDGFETATRIRALDAENGRHTPIIAMTGNVQPGTASKCLAAGMDDYLPKPITLSDLHRIIDKWIRRLVPKQPSELVSLERKTFEQLRGILGNALPHVLVPFLEDSPLYLDEFELAVMSGSCPQAQAKAHVLKTSAGNLGAEILSALCAEAEELAIAEKIDAIKPMVARIRSAYRELEGILQKECEAIGGIQPETLSNLPVRRALVVDDDVSSRRMMRLSLERGNFSVDEASDGYEALESLKRIRPDVILMDAIMPAMDGFTACALITQHEDSPPIPVVLVTGLDDRHSIESAFKAGASDVFTKPIDYATLPALVRRVLALP